MSLIKKIVVVDVGCRWGFAENYLDQLENFQLYGFDPDKDECDRLNKRYGTDAIKAIPLGLAGEPGNRVLYLTKEPACSSLIQPDAELTTNYPALNCAKEVGQTEVSTTTLDLWASSEGVDYIDHLKIDTQGSELEILHGGITILKTVRSIEVEVEFNPIYTGQPVFSDVDQFLRSQGFVLWKFSNFVHYSKRVTPGNAIGNDIICFDDFHLLKNPVYAGQVYWANAHYVRDNIVSNRPPSTSEDRLRDAVLLKVLGMPDVIGDV